jgi:hypothetical protein
VCGPVTVSNGRCFQTRATAPPTLHKQAPIATNCQTAYLHQNITHRSHCNQNDTNWVHLSPHTCAHVLCAPPRARYVFLSKGTRTVPFAKPSARSVAAAHDTNIGCNRRTWFKQVRQSSDTDWSHHFSQPLSLFTLVLASSIEPARTPRLPTKNGYQKAVLIDNPGTNLWKCWWRIQRGV